jgi:hypothetical protein
MVRSALRSALSLLLCGSMLMPAFARTPDAMKQEPRPIIDGHAELVQEMVDSAFQLWRTLG